MVLPAITNWLEITRKFKFIERTHPSWSLIIDHSRRGMSAFNAIWQRTFLKRKIRKFSVIFTAKYLRVFAKLQFVFEANGIFFFEFNPRKPPIERTATLDASIALAKCKIANQLKIFKWPESTVCHSKYRCSKCIYIWIGAATGNTRIFFRFFIFFQFKVSFLSRSWLKSERKCERVFETCYDVWPQPQWQCITGCRRRRCQSRWCHVHWINLDTDIKPDRGKNIKMLSGKWIWIIFFSLFLSLFTVVLKIMKQPNGDGKNVEEKYLSYDFLRFK